MAGNIILEVFDDGQQPLTCARWFGAYGRPPEICQHLMTERYGTIYVCGIFKDHDRTKSSNIVLEYVDPANEVGLIPCDDCLKARALANALITKEDTSEHS